MESTTELLEPENGVNLNSQVIIVELKPVVWGAFRNFHGMGRYGPSNIFAKYFWASWLQAERKQNR